MSEKKGECLSSIFKASCRYSRYLIWQSTFWNLLKISYLMNLAVDGEYFLNNMTTLIFVTKRHCDFLWDRTWFPLELQCSYRRSGFIRLSPHGSMLAKLCAGYRYQYLFYSKVLWRPAAVFRECLAHISVRIPAIKTYNFRGLYQSLHVSILYITAIRSRKLSFKSLALCYSFLP
jgi:hypothetical protein